MSGMSAASSPLGDRRAKMRCYKCDAEVKGQRPRKAGACAKCMSAVEQWEQQKGDEVYIGIVDELDFMGLWNEDLDGSAREV